MKTTHILLITGGIIAACFLLIKKGIMANPVASGNKIKDALLKRFLERQRFTIERSKKLAELAYLQCQFETANFTSSVYRNNNNVCGYKYYAGSLWQSKTPGTASPEGNSYAKFDSVEKSCYELVDWICRRSTFFANVNNVNDYALAMKSQGFFGVTASHYAAGMSSFA